MSKKVKQENLVQFLRDHGYDAVNIAYTGYSGCSVEFNGVTTSRNRPDGKCIFFVPLIEEEILRTADFYNAPKLPPKPVVKKPAMDPFEAELREHLQAIFDLVVENRDMSGDIGEDYEFADSRTRALGLLRELTNVDQMIYVKKSRRDGTLRAVAKNLKLDASKLPAPKPRVRKPRKTQVPNCT